MRIGLGGGCHWCTEAVFQALRCVERVEQGFIRSTPPHDAFSEAVIVHFEPRCIPLETIIEVHVRTHAATSDHRMRGKYRSAIYAFGEEQAGAARHILARLQKRMGQCLITRVLPFAGFRASDARFHDYYRTNPRRPFCRDHIDPKLALIRREFAREVSKPR